MKENKTLQRSLIFIILILTLVLGYSLSNEKDLGKQENISADLGEVFEESQVSDTVEEKEVEQKEEEVLDEEIETETAAQEEEILVSESEVEVKSHIEPEQKTEPQNIESQAAEDNEEIVEEVDNSEEVQEDKAEGSENYYPVVKVVDGDTIDVEIDGAVERLRLIGINTPESVDPRKPVECFGIEASNKAKEMLMGRLVALESDPTQGERGKYGRLLRYVRTQDGLFYNLEIIKQGYAFEYTYDTVYKYQAEFKSAEEYAQENELGLWADGACDNYQAEEESGEEVVEVPEDGEYICSHNEYNCSHFSTQAEAQAVYDYCGGANNDVHRLDGSDKDGVVCEGLE